MRGRESEKGGSAGWSPGQWSIVAVTPRVMRVKDPGRGRYLELSAKLPLQGFSH